jgi:hypothetical protein
MANIPNPTNGNIQIVGSPGRLPIAMRAIPTVARIVHSAQNPNQKVKNADARKTKALADAGLRLVRISAGALPSKDKLREIIDADRASPREHSEIPTIHHFVAAEPELRLAEDWGSAPTDAPVAAHERAASRAVKVAVLRMVLGGAVLVFGWVVYTQLVPVVVQRAFRPLTARHVPPSSTAPRSSPALGPVRITAVPVVAGTSQQELAEKRRAELQAAADLQRQKDHVWLAYYYRLFSRQTHWRSFEIRLGH